MKAVGAVCILIATVLLGERAAQRELRHLATTEGAAQGLCGLGIRNRILGFRSRGGF